MKMHDEYCHSAGLRIYIKASLHTDTYISSQLSDRYLAIKCLQVIAPHEQHTQTTDGSTMEPEQKAILSLNTGGYVANKRAMDDSSDASKIISTTPCSYSKKRYKPVGICGGNTVGNTIPTSDFLDTVKAAFVNRPDLYPPAIKNQISSLAKSTKEQCEAAILTGSCIICHEQRRYRQSPVLKGTLPTAVLAKQLLNEYHNIKKTENPQ